MNWGLRKKLIVFLILATVIPFGTSILLTYVHTIRTINEESLSYNTEQMQKGKEELATYLEDIALMSTVLYRYTPFMNVLTKGIEETESNIEEVRRVLAYVYNSRTEIEQMHLYISNGNDSFTNYHSRISGRGKNKTVYFHSYYKKLEDIKAVYSMIEPPHTIYSYNELSIIPNSEKTTVLSFHNKIRNVPSDEILGFLSIDINFSKIDGMIDKINKEKEELYIMNENGTIIYSPDATRAGKKNKEKWFTEVQRKKKGNHMQWEDDEFSGVIMYESFKVQNNNWYMVKRIPFDSLYKNARDTAFLNTMIALIALIVVIAITMIISVKITAPIKVLIENMKKVEKGNLEVDFETLGSDEIGMLGKHFKSMIKKINRLIEKEYKLQIENKDVQLKVLQSQINPHFLYNSFQSIGTLALKSNATDVYSLLTSLSLIMRYSMNMRESSVPLSMEINHVKAYLALQKQRFEEELEVSIQEDPHSKNILVPKMILQPIVENCFKHGFRHQMNHSEIVIRSYTREGFLIIEVKDNGKGVTQDQVEKILTGLKNSELIDNENERESIGLKNIYDRLTIYYGKDANLYIESDEYKGFSVTICLPILFPKEETT